MRNKPYIVVFLIGLFVVSAVQLSGQTQNREQQRTPAENKGSRNKQQKEIATLKRKEQRLQLISYLDGIAQKTAGLEPVEDRIRVLIEVGDAFWFLDKARAATLFTQSFQSIDSLLNEAGGDTKQIHYRIASLRQITLARIARRDPALAAKLMSNASMPPATPERQWAEMNGIGTPYAETLIQVARTLLKTDLKQSISLARLAMRDGMSQAIRLYLQELRMIDQQPADLLLELSLRESAARNSARLFDVLAYWEYTFQPGAFYFGAISWPKGTQTRSYQVAQPLKLAVLQFAVAAINQNIQQRLSTSDSNGATQTLQPALLYSVVQQLMPYIAAEMPGAADALRAELGVLEQAIRTSGQRLPELNTSSPSTLSNISMLDNLLYKAERAGFGKERDELYLAAAYQLLFDSQFEKAASLASRIDDLEMKNGITDAINFNWTGSLLAAGNTNEALQVVRTIRTQEPRVVALAKIGAVLAGKGEAVVAEEILNESQTIASKTTPSPVIGAAILSVAMARARTQRDATKAFEALSLAVSIINKSNSDNLLWQILNPPSGAALLKVASLNSVASPNGGLKSITVTYPRLAGLREVFAETSRQDLNQAMSVAQDLSSKALSLAVQASVCNAFAERLSREEEGE